MDRQTDDSTNQSTKRQKDDRQTRGQTTEFVYTSIGQTETRTGGGGGGRHIEVESICARALNWDTLVSYYLVYTNVSLFCIYETISLSCNHMDVQSARARINYKLRFHFPFFSLMFYLFCRDKLFLLVGITWKQKRVYANWTTMFLFSLMCSLDLKIVCANEP